MPKGIKGNGGSWSLIVASRVSAPEGNSTSKCICAFPPFSCWQTPWNSINQRQTISTHNSNRHCHVRFCAFVGQPLLKQLYSKQEWMKVKQAVNLDPL